MPVNQNNEHKQSSIIIIFVPSNKVMMKKSGLYLFAVATEVQLSFLSWWAP
jgi:hypothetical protein